MTLARCCPEQLSSAWRSRECTPPASSICLTEFARASQLYGAIGTTVVSLAWFFILGRVIAIAMVLNPVIYERIGSVSTLVFSLPLLRVLARRSAWIRRFFDIDPRDSSDTEARLARRSQNSSRLAGRKRNDADKQEDPVADPVVHFEVAGKDAAALQAFYASLFDWKIDANNPMSYGMVEPAKGGIGGGVGPSPDGQRHLTWYV